ncbi:MAG: hypothetical protein H6665_01090, partial [Ardenticatenaceae bacterium]|nr:hypothetical protein [Ardenticatenaceae bacterium]
RGGQSAHVGPAVFPDYIPNALTHHGKASPWHGRFHQAKSNIWLLSTQQPDYPW